MICLGFGFALLCFAEFYFTLFSYEQSKGWAGVSGIGDGGIGVQNLAPLCFVLIADLPITSPSPHPNPLPSSRPSLALGNTTTEGGGRGGERERERERETIFFAALNFYLIYVVAVFNRRLMRSEP